ncbi:MAG: NADH-quinone oxidoreductase subunit C [Chitinophagaceae bacterium]|nr:NADH-quinone oxidoreductase subunit C [Chitinophagaceae bacterium]
MENEQMFQKLQAIWPEASVTAGRQWTQLEVSVAKWPEVATALRNHNDLLLDYLFCLTCVDWLKHLTMVYHLTSTVYRHSLVVKVQLDRNNAIIDTVSSIWKTAEFHEREVYELFGVHFSGHPDLRKLILPDDWEGYPLRKDYEDPINMIKL